MLDDLSTWKSNNSLSVPSEPGANQRDSLTAGQTRRRSSGSTCSRPHHRTPFFRTSSLYSVRWLPTKPSLHFHYAAGPVAALAGPAGPARSCWTCNLLLDLLDLHSAAGPAGPAVFWISWTDCTCTLLDKLDLNSTAGASAHCHWAPAA